MDEREKQTNKKRELLQEWLEQFNTRTIIFCESGNKIDKSFVLNQIQNQSITEDNWIYILTMKKDRSYIPLYIGKTNSPYNRWKSHIEKIEKNKGLYKSWNEAIFNSEKTAVEDLYLYLVAQSDITKPPLPGFPITVGAIEYQLISMASDLYPEFLLNREGNRR